MGVILLMGWTVALAVFFGILSSWRDVAQTAAELVTDEFIIADEMLRYCGGGMLPEVKVVPVRVTQTALYYGSYTIPLGKITDVKIRTRGFGLNRKLEVGYNNGVRAKLIFAEYRIGAKGMYVVQSALIQALTTEQKQTRPVMRDNVIRGFLS